MDDRKISLQLRVFHRSPFTVGPIIDRRQSLFVHIVMHRKASLVATVISRKPASTKVLKLTEAFSSALLKYPRNFLNDNTLTEVFYHNAFYS